MRLIREHKYLFIVIFVFASIYTLISIVNHYYFRTYALDLGAYTNALYDYIHFQWNDSLVFKSIAENLLADHFDLYLIIFSPFSLLFGTYTLLILQIVFILLGGVGVYRYFLLSKNGSKYALPATLYFYLFFGVFSAMSFDYHSNTVAASLLPWFFYWVKREKVLASSLILLILLIAKENMSLWLAFVCLALIIAMWRKPIWRYYMMTAFAFCILYFVVITMLVMPALSSQQMYPHFHYSVLGDNPAEALLFLLSHPIESIRTFFINHTGDPNGDYIKLEFLVLLMVSGLYILLRKPLYLIMLIPLFFQKFFHDNYPMWGLHAQYNVEFSPVLAIGIFSAVSAIKRKTYRNTVLILAMAGCLLATVRIMDHTIMFTDKARIRIYQEKHYSRNYDVKKVHRALKLIPNEAVVCAQSPFLPHLALRDHIYQFPSILNADYLVFSYDEDRYPLTEIGFDKKINQIMSSGQWEEFHKEGNFIILKKTVDILQEPSGVY